MFTNIKQQVKSAFDAMVLSGLYLYIVDVEKDKLWEAYLENFSEETKQQHNCNCCRQFIKNYGGIVTVNIDGTFNTVWDFIPEAEYLGSVNALGTLVREARIRNRFINDFIKLGTDKNYDMERQCTWEHFYVEAPKSILVKRDEKDRVWAQYRTNKDLFMRAMTELTLDSAETVLDLISQNSLYRGKEFQGLVEQWAQYKRAWDAKSPSLDPEIYAWVETTRVPQSVISIRNSAIGQLLIDLSAGEKSLDEAVTAFERMVAPTNYKRPTALISKGMIEEAEKTLDALGLKESLGRRFATPEDIDVNNVLFINRDSKKAETVFEELKEDVSINPKTFSKVEEVSIETFVKDILPNSTSIELLLESTHLSNLVSLIGPKEPSAPGLFKWSNPFSWSYTNALADSMKERVKAAGGKVDGVLRFSIQWNDNGDSICDFDAHCQEPGINGRHIYYSSKNNAATTGQLDVDMINPRGTGVENITWSDPNKMLEGTYKFWIKNFNSGRNTGFSAEIEFNGEVYSFSKQGNIQGDTMIAEVTYSKTTGFTIKTLMDPSSTGSVYSREKWGVSTNKFQKVNMILNSPNYWTDSVGNKHVIFVIEGAKCDETPRGFFNEFLHQDLDKNRKVFEVLGNKIKVEPSDRQVTGVGFSDTQRNAVICKVKGKFERTIKLVF